MALDTRGGLARPIAGADHSSASLPQIERSVDEPGLHLVQFHGPIKQSWIETLRSEGLDVIAYVPENAYLVRASPTQVGLLESAPFETGPAGRSPLHWHGPYVPEYKVRAALLDTAPGELLDVVVRLADGPRAQERLARLTDDGRRAISDPVRVGRAWVAPVRMTPEAVATWPAEPDVIGITRWRAPQLAGEVGALNVAGQRVDGTVPGFGDAGVGYLEWLEQRDFATSQTWDVVVHLPDSGLDNGNAAAPWHPDFATPDGASDRIAFIKDWTSEAGTLQDGVDGSGHGTNCAGIVGGYNDAPGTGTGEVSTAGYHFGLGVAPNVRLGGTKVFDSDGIWDYWDDYRQLEEYAHARGARISSNSWGSESGEYTWDSAVYDELVRDASSNSGSQPMVILFAAGNEGPSTGTITSPGTAKNVITLGAAENWWPGYSSCGWSPAMTDTPGDDIPYYSSRGPVSDGRIKPDLAAIAQGWLTTRGEQAGAGCGPPFDGGDPDLYRNFNGTSAATPAAAGAAALIYRHALREWGGPPSPAMVKAVLVATARDMAGGIDCNASDGTGPEIEPVPNGSQGWGLIDTGRAFDGAPVVRVDQSVVFDATGQSWSEVVTPADPSQPVRVTLAWTDAPADVYTAPWVNDLDLAVVHRIRDYHGNQLEGGVSVAGGTADAKNNVEVVILPASARDAIDVEVVAANVAGDGLPSRGDATDQDFALYVYNARACAQPSPPTGIDASFDGDVVELTWSASSSGSLSGNRIYRSSSEDGPWSWIDMAAADATRYVDETVPADWPRAHYVVRAVAQCESPAPEPATASRPSRELRGLVMCERSHGPHGRLSMWCDGGAPSARHAPAPSP